MNTDVSPHPEDPDVHLRVTLGGCQLDFAACLTSALCFVREQKRRHFLDALEVIIGDTTDLPRLPNERLYDGS